MQLLAPLPNETMRDYALRVLKRNIISLDMEPGGMYSEKELAAALGLSRTPMREALQQLAKIKIVQIYPQRGSAVALIDYDLVEEVRFVRDALECAVVRLAAQVATPQQLSALESNVRRQQKCVRLQDLDPLLQLDNIFHRMLFTIANKMQSYEYIDSIAIHFDRVRSMALTTVKDIGFVEEHQQLYQAISSGDGDLAASLMHGHLNRFRVDEKPIREKYPQYFKA